MIEMRLASVSTRRIVDVREIPWGADTYANAISNFNEKAPKAVNERLQAIDLRTHTPAWTASTSSVSRPCQPSA